MPHRPASGSASPDRADQGLERLAFGHPRGAGASTSPGKNRSYSPGKNTSYTSHDTVPEDYDEGEDAFPTAGAHAPVQESRSNTSTNTKRRNDHYAIPIGDANANKNKTCAHTQTQPCTQTQNSIAHSTKHFSISPSSPSLDYDLGRPRIDQRDPQQYHHHHHHHHHTRPNPPRSDTSYGDRSFDYEDRYDTYGYRRTPELGSSPIGSQLGQSGPSRAQQYMDQYQQLQHRYQYPQSHSHSHSYQTPPNQYLHSAYQQHASSSGSGSTTKRRPQSLYASSPHRERTRRPASVLSPRTVPRTTRTTSNNHGEWHVRASGPTTGVEDTTSRARLDRREPGGAESELSSLCAPGMPNNNTNKRRTWGGSLINGAVSAAVFSAAVGLTAYRLWKSWGNEDDDAGQHADDDGDAYLRPDPPEIYEPEGLGGRLGAESVLQDAMQTPPRPPPSQASSSMRSPPSTRRRAVRKRAQRPSIAELVIATARAGAQGKHPASPVTSVSASITTAPVSELSKSPRPEYPTLSEDVAEVAEEDETDDEMNARLDEMARRLQGLIAEGNRALASKPSPPASAVTMTPELGRSEWSFMRDTEDGKPSPQSESSFATFATAPTAPASATDSVLSRRHSERTPLRTDSTRRTQSTSSRPQSISSHPQSISSHPQSVSSLSRARPKQDTLSSPSPVPFPSSPTTSPSASSSSTLPSVPIPGSKGMPPRDRTGSWTRGLPPLPWRRDPSGESRWVQRPLSPSAPERSTTPVPPVPPIPPELATGRPQSMIYLQKRNSTKRYSTPPLKLALGPRRSGPASPGAHGSGSPSPAMSPARSRAGSSASNADRPVPQSPLGTWPRKGSPVTASPISSRIPRHVRASSFASNASPPASPTPAMRSRPLTSASVSSTLSSSLSETSGVSGSGSASGSGVSATLSGPRLQAAAASPKFPPTVRRHQSLDWRDTPTTATRLRFARRAGSEFEPASPSTPGPGTARRRDSVGPVTPGIVAARTAAITGVSPERGARTPRTPQTPQYGSPQTPKTPGSFFQRPQTPTTPQSAQTVTMPSNTRPQTPGSAGSGRSRIPVRRSIDPDSFSAFGRIE